MTPPPPGQSQQLTAPGSPGPNMPTLPPGAVQVDLHPEPPQLAPSTIEHADGSVTIELNPQRDGIEKPTDHLANLAEHIAPDELQRISADLLAGIDDDERSRQSWLADRAQGMDLLGLTLPKKGAGDGADGVISQVRHPLLLDAVLRFQANARGELLPAEGPVKARVDGDTTEALQEAAQAIEDRLNHHLTKRDKNYYPDTDRLLFMTGFSGCGFKKIYRHPIKRFPVSESVDAEDIIVSNTASDFSNCGRITQRIKMRPSIMKRMQILGVYRTVELDDPVDPEKDALDSKKDKIQGVNEISRRPEDREREIYECYCELDIAGFEHEHEGKQTGLQVPYRVTIDKSSKEILEIRRNWRPDDIFCMPRIPFVKFPFALGIGFYGIGLLHILGNATHAVTGAWRQLLDAGAFANFPGGLIAKQGSKQANTNIRVAPGQLAPVETPSGARLQDSVMPLPYKGPDATLMQLVENVVDTGRQVGGAPALQIGEGTQNAPVGTTLALIEQATKTMDAVHKRLHAAQAEEFELLKDLFLEDPAAMWLGEEDSWNPAEHIKIMAGLRASQIVPAADPNTPSHMHRLMLAQGLVQLAQVGGGSLFNMREIAKRVLAMMRFADADQLLADPNQPPQPDPKTAAAQLKAQGDRDKLQAQTQMAAEKNQLESRKLDLQEQAQGQNAALKAGEAQVKANAQLADQQLQNHAVEMQTAAHVHGDLLKHSQVQAQLADKAAERASRERIEGAHMAATLAVHPEAAPAFVKAAKKAG